MNAAVRACEQTSAQRALARVQHAMQSSTGSGVVTVCFVDKLLTELSTLTHPFHTYTIVVPSLLLARRAFVVLSFLFITSMFTSFICCVFLLLALLLRRPSRGHRAVRGALGVYSLIRLRSCVRTYVWSTASFVF